MKQPRQAPLRPWDVSRPGIVGLLAAALLLSTLCAVHSTASKQDAASRRIHHTYEVLHALDNVLEALAESEAAVRAFVLTQNAGLLSDFERSAAAMGEHLRHSLELTKDNLDQQKRLQALVPMLRTRHEQLLDHVRLVRSTSRPSAPSAEALKLSSDLRIELRSAISVERSLLISRERAGAEEARRTHQWIVVAGLLALVLAIFTYSSLYRRSRALHLSREELRLMIEGAPIGVAALHLDGKWMRVNDAFCRIVGYSREELLERDFQSITHPDDLELDLAHVAKLLGGDCDSYSLEKRYVHRNGHTIWARLSASIVRSPSGIPDFFIAQVEDITARREAESQARMFFESSLDLLAITGHSGRLEHVNSAWERALGWTVEEITSRPYFEFVHPDDLSRTLAEAAALREGRGSTVDFQNRYRTKDGSYRWLDWTAQQTAEGRLFCVVRDVTDRIEAERALRVLERAVSAARNGIVMTDPNSPGNPMVFVNPAFEAMTGYSSAELLGESCRILQGASRNQPEVEALRSAVNDGRECHVVLRNYRKNGEPFVNSVAVAPVRDGAGRILRYVGITEDITERVRTEQKVREQAAILRSVLDSMNDAVLVADRDGNVLLFNEPMMALTSEHATDEPASAAAVIQAFESDQVTPCSSDSLPVQRALRGECVREKELWVPTSDGRGCWVSVSASPVRDSQGVLLGAVSVSRDITGRKRTELATRHAAIHDELTGLLNRRGFTEAAEQQLRLADRQGRTMHLLFVDLNDMKRINDELGHENGDRALVETAAILREVFRSSDTLGRLGGDEFVVLAEGGYGAAANLCERVQHAAEVWNRNRTAPYSLSLSIGMATYSPNAPTSIAHLLRSADAAMYAVKKRMKSTSPDRGLLNEVTIAKFDREGSG